MRDKIMKLSSTSITLLMYIFTIPVNTTCMLWCALKNRPQLREKLFTKQPKRFCNNDNKNTQHLLQQIQKLKEENKNKGWYASEPASLLMRIDAGESILSQVIKHMETQDRAFQALTERLNKLEGNQKIDHQSIDCLQSFVPEWNMHYRNPLTETDHK